jgi:hypothetical protein
MVIAQQERGQAFLTCNNMDEQNSPGTKCYILHAFTYMNFKNRLDISVVIEIKTD